MPFEKTKTIKGNIFAITGKYVSCASRSGADKSLVIFFAHTGNYYLTRDIVNNSGYYQLLFIYFLLLRNTVPICLLELENTRLSGPFELSPKLFHTGEILLIVGAVASSPIK
jgi:hypothetical protein